VPATLRLTLTHESGRIRDLLGTAAQGALNEIVGQGPPDIWPLFLNGISSGKQRVGTYSLSVVRQGPGEICLDLGVLADALIDPLTALFDDVEKLELGKGSTWSLDRIDKHASSIHALTKQSALLHRLLRRCEVLAAGLNREQALSPRLRRPA